MSTALRYCPIDGQRLRVQGHNASLTPGSKAPNSRTLRPERLEWSYNLSGKPTGGAPHRGQTRAPYDLELCKCRSSAKIAASLNQASSLNHTLNTQNARLEAMARAFPTFSNLSQSRGGPP